MKRLRRYALWLLLGFLALLGILLWYPVRDTITRSGIVASIAAADLLFIFMGLPRRRLRWVPIGLTIGAGLFLLLPGRAFDSAALRDRYLVALRSYDHVTYIWGGEARRGVDCSGLLRAAMVDAQWHQALCTMNPALARNALWLWWNDASAADLSNGTRGVTYRLGTNGSLTELPDQVLEAGDLAVTADGSHVLAYLGDRRWIEADPTANVVLQLDMPGILTWQAVQFSPCRWECLRGASTARATANR